MKFFVESHTRKAADRVSAVAFTDETLLMGDIRGQVVAVKMEEKETVVLRAAAEPGRIKAMAVAEGITAIGFSEGLVEIYRSEEENVVTV